MTQEQPDYASYLLRLWRSEQDESSVWRASLQSTRDGGRLNFASLEALVAFLRTQYDLNSDLKQDTPVPARRET